MSTAPPFKFFDLEGRTLLITGTTRGIGKALLPGFLAQGLNLVCVSRNLEVMRAVRDELEVDESRMRLYQCDLGENKEVLRVTRGISEKEEKLDALLHNAAIDPRQWFEKMTPEEWFQIWQTNFRSAAVLTQGLLPLLRQSDQGRIIFTSSVMLELGGACLSGYASSKGAVEGLVLALANELQGTGITVNCIVPGAVQVEKEVLSKERNDLLISWQGVPRRLVPEDLMGLICLFLSKAGGGVSRQIVAVDGGLLHPLGSKGFRESHGRLRGSDG